MSNFSFKSFGIVLLVGLVCLLIVFIIMYIRKKISDKNHKKAMAELKKMLSTRMEIENEGVNSVKTEVDALKKENENMRITLSTLDQKAGRKETRQLQLYQIAIEKRMVSSAGFAPAWQQELSEAEQSLRSSIVGKIPFVGRFITSGNSHILIEDKDSLK